MARQRSRTIDYLVYLLVRSLVCVIQALPWRWSLSLAEGMAWLAHRVDRRHRQVASENLRYAFPELSQPKIDHLVKKVYRHFCKMVFEMVMLPRKYRHSNVESYVSYADLKQFQYVDEILKRGRPVILMTGHLGNWEVLSYSLGVAGYRGAVIARSLDNPWLDRFIKQFRIRTGQRILAKKGDFDQIQACLANGEHLGVVGDQDAGARGLFVNFFNRPASTFKAIALLSLEYQAPILVMGATRAGNNLEYHLHLGDAIFPEEYAQRSDAVIAITERYTQALEKMIRQFPEQYFWLHRRWKHQPKVRQKKAA